MRKKSINHTKMCPITSMNSVYNCSGYCWYPTEIHLVTGTPSPAAASVDYQWFMATFFSG